MKKSQPSPTKSTVDRHDIYVGSAQLKQVRVPPRTTLASAYKHFEPMSFKKRTTLEFNSTASFTPSSSDEKSPRTIEFYLGDKLIFSPATLNYRANKNNPPQQSSCVISVTEIRNASRQRYSFYLMYTPCDKQNYEQAWIHFPKATIDFMLQPQCMSFLRQQLESSPLLPQFETRNGSNHRTKLDNLLKALSSNAPQRKSRPVHYFKQWWIIYNNCVNRFFNQTATPLQPILPATPTPPKIKAPQKGTTQGSPSSKSDQPTIDFDRINYQPISNNTLVKDGNEFRAAEIFQHKTQFHIVISYLNETDDELEGLPLPGQEGNYWAYHDLPPGRQRISHHDIIKRAVSSLDNVRIYFTDGEQGNKLVRILFQSSKKHTPPKRRINSPSAAASNKKQKSTGKKASPSTFLYQDSSLSASQNSLLSHPDTPCSSSNSNPFEVNHCVALLYCYSQHLCSPSFHISHLQAMTASLNEWFRISRPQHYPCIQQQLLALTNQISTALTHTEATPLATRMHLSLFRARLLTHLPKTDTLAPQACKPNIPSTTMNPH